MNENIRTAVRRRLQEKNISQNKFASQISLQSGNFSRLICGKSAPIPRVWKRILDELDLTLIAIQKEKIEE